MKTETFITSQKKAAAISPLQEHAISLSRSFPYGSIQQLCARVISLESVESGVVYGFSKEAADQMKCIDELLEFHEELHNRICLRYRQILREGAQKILQHPAAADVKRYYTDPVFELAFCLLCAGLPIVSRARRLTKNNRLTLWNRRLLTAEEVQFDADRLLFSAPQGFVRIIEKLSRRTSTRYYYQIEEIYGRYFFAFYQSRRSDQPIAASEWYDTYREANQRLSALKRMIEQNLTRLSDLMNIERTDKSLRFVLCCESQVPFLTSVDRYRDELSCITGMRQFLYEYAAPLKTEKATLEASTSVE